MVHEYNSGKALIFDSKRKENRKQKLKEFIILLSFIFNVLNVKTALMRSCVLCTFDFTS